MTLLVESYRGNYVENKHYGSFAVLNDQGKIIDSQGNVEHPIFGRSTLKLMQTLSLIESGAADTWNLSDKEIALSCASHFGEEMHVQLGEKWAKRLAIGEKELYCGPHKPVDSEAAKQLIRRNKPITVFHNPCSGKHLGFITTALHLEESAYDYISRKHMVQKRVEQILSEMTSFETLMAPFGVDGCSAPAFTFPLHNLALGYARFGSNDCRDVPFNRRKAAQRIIGAIRNHPLLFAGTKGFDTKVVELTQGKVIVKTGACSVMIATVPDKSIGIALKIEDGSNRIAAEIVMVHLLHRHGLITEEEYRKLGPVRPIMSQAGHKVGEMKVANF